MADENWIPTGQQGMLLSNARTHKFLNVSFRTFAWCDWCKGVIWGMGKQGLRCVDCEFKIHKKCEADFHRNLEEKKKMCRGVQGDGEVGERPTFRFKVSRQGNNALIEIDPNKARMITYALSAKEKKTEVPCSRIVVEKPVTDTRRLYLYNSADGSKTTIVCGSVREREQLAACLAFLSKQVLKPMSTTPLRIFCGTWNMGDAPPPDLNNSSQRLSDFLHPEENYDIVCVTVQECEYKPRYGNASCEEDWNKTVEAVMGPGYYRVEKHSMWSIRILVLARNEYKPFITQVRKAQEATGVARVGGNKGGVAIGFSLRETRLCFVGSHLAAHQERWENRNKDHFEIIGGCKGLGLKDFWMTNEFHHVFWAGDLNYRIDHVRHKVVELCYKGVDGWDQLYKYDQLQSQLRHENSFLEFNESQPFFQPTYRYARHENVYPDDAKQRIPSWCDRVLWKSLSNEVATQEDYTSVQSVMTSDHRPVYTVFRVQVRNQFIPRSIISPLTSPPSSRALEVLDVQPKSRFIIRQFAGHDLDSADPNGFSDPYVIFLSRVLLEQYQTKVQLRTLHPVWDDVQVPALYATFDEVDYLETEYIFFSVYDWDRTSQDDPLGQGHLSLKGLCDGRVHNFCVRTLGAGKTAGTLTGSIQFLIS
eukprot:Rhum_TRINITY_DN15544_c0_g1::Rhum_TRINITY_DN15544_c0_g1_i1::g.161178::m.161178/K15909/SHIP2, INPPL1; phosphatidylinositol-3,4,5-trisphosphate 5-phosphatase 2